MSSSRVLIRSTKEASVEAVVREIFESFDYRGWIPEGCSGLESAPGDFFVSSCPFWCGFGRFCYQ